MHSRSREQLVKHQTVMRSNITGDVSDNFSLAIVLKFIILLTSN